MHIDIRCGNVKLPRAHAVGLAQHIRDAFDHLAHRIARIVVRPGDAARPGITARECTVEVHLANGEIAVVKERQRRLGALLRRVTHRARKAAAALITRQPDAQPLPKLPSSCGQGGRA